MLNLLNDVTLVVSSSEIVEIDGLLDIGLHIADELELNIGLKESPSGFVEAFVEYLLVDDRRIAHLLESKQYTPH